MKRRNLRFCALGSVAAVALGLCARAGPGRYHMQLLACQGSSPGARLRFNVLEASWRIQNEGQATASTPTASLSISPTMPLELVKLEMRGEPPHLEYTLRNTGAKSIVAIAVKWTLRVADEPSATVIRLSKDDLWPDGAEAWLAPGKDKVFYLGGAFTREGKPVTMDGELTYVELEDGTRLGTGADTIFAELTRTREAVLAEYRRALTAYNRSGKDGLNPELADARSSAKTDKARAVAAGALQSWLTQKGLAATVAYLKRTSALQVPH